MGELDEVSLAIGELRGDVKAVIEQNKALFKKLDAIGANCQTERQTLSGLETRLAKVEAKDALGGTSRAEKVGLWGTVAAILYIVASAIAKALGIPVPSVV